MLLSFTLSPCNSARNQNIMRLLLPVTLFSSCVSTFALPPLITPAPQIAVRDVAPNVCGYHLVSGSIDTISCELGTSCLVATYLSPAVVYCSRSDYLPVTTIYPWGFWPSTDGCGPGAACCLRATPNVGEYLFDGGSTVLLACGLSRFTSTAFFFSEEGSPNPSTPTTNRVAAPATAIPTTTEPTFGLTTSPFLAPTDTQTTPPPSQTPSSSRLSSTTTITIVVVGTVVALVGGLVFLWFLYMAWKLHHKAKYPQQQYTPLYYQNSNPSLHSVPPVKKSGLSKWAKIATIISPIFAIVGLVLAIYFGLRQN